MTAPILTLTDAGVTAVASALNPLASVVLSTFQIGSGFGYTPTTTETGLHGTLLFTGAVTSATTQADGSVLINCTIPASAGPFQFGEIAVYTSTTILFGVATLPTLETKYSSLSTGIASTFTFGLLVKTGTTTADVISVAAATAPSPVQYAGDWAMVVDQSIGTATPFYFTIVSQVDNKGDYTTLVWKADGKWSVQSNYFAMKNGQTVLSAAVDGSYIVVTAAAWADLNTYKNILVADASNYTFLFQANGGGYRQVSSVAMVGLDVQITFASSLAGLAATQPFKLWVNA